MDDLKIKTNILDKLRKLLKINSELKINPQTKIKILDRYIFAQFAFYFKVYNLSLTWISEKLDSLCISYIRSWCEAPVSSCIAEWLIAPQNKCGLGVPSFKNRAERLHLSKRSSLQKSKNCNIQILWEESKLKNVNADSRLINNQYKTAKSILVKEQQNAAMEHFHNLSYQGKSVKTITGLISPNKISNWVQTINKLPGYLFNFTWKALQSQLPTLANLKRWGRSVDDKCPLCSNIQTNKHVLSNCGSKAALSRYTERHNNVLGLLAKWINDRISKTHKLYVDLPYSNFLQQQDLFSNLRPDLAIVTNNKIVVLELTICHETNLESSKSYKINKYKHLKENVTERFKHLNLSVCTCELSVLGVLSIDDSFFNDVGISKFDNSFLTELSRTVINLSFDIYNQRHNVIL